MGAQGPACLKWIFYEGVEAFLQTWYVFTYKTLYIFIYLPTHKKKGGVYISISKGRERRQEFDSFDMKWLSNKFETDGKPIWSHEI